MLSKEFFEDNELGIDLERNAEILQTPLPVGFISPNQNYPQINLHPTYPLNVLLSSGKALKNLVISQISPDIEGKTSAVTFDLNQVCTFRSRDLVFIFSSKLVLLTRGTILSVNKLTVKVLPEQDFADFNDSQHFVLTKAGSEVTSKRNMTSLKQLSDQNPHASIFTLHPFFQQISTKLLDFPSLNASQTAAASKIAQIGHKQLLVIQGPPGTGKTTTLAAGIEMPPHFDHGRLEHGGGQPARAHAGAAPRVRGARDARNRAFFARKRHPRDEKSRAQGDAKGRRGVPKAAPEGPEKPGENWRKGRLYHFAERASAGTEDAKSGHEVIQKRGFRRPEDRRLHAQHRCYAA